ncbi:MAG: hypothetical protein ACAH79_01780, partial [Thermoleophilia bacterium]
MRGYRTKKISLPGGRVIEIVYFNEPGESEVAGLSAEAVQRALEAPEDEAADDAGPAPPLHTCPACTSDLVYPVEWEESSGTSWTVERRCPNCEWR